MNAQQLVDALADLFCDSFETKQKLIEILEQDLKNTTIQKMSIVSKSKAKLIVTINNKEFIFQIKAVKK